MKHSFVQSQQHQSSHRCLLHNTPRQLLVFLTHAVLRCFLLSHCGSCRRAWWWNLLLLLPANKQARCKGELSVSSLFCPGPGTRASRPLSLTCGRQQQRAGRKKGSLLQGWQEQTIDQTTGGLRQPLARHTPGQPVLLCDDVVEGSQLKILTHTQ